MNVPAPVATPENEIDPMTPVRVFHTNKIGGSLVHGPIIDPETGKPRLDEEGKQISFILEPGGDVIVPKYVADIWLTHTHFGSPVCALSKDAVSPKSDALQAERDALANETKEQAATISDQQARLDALQTQLTALKQTQKPTDLGTSPSPEELAAQTPPPEKKSKK